MGQQMVAPRVYARDPNSARSVFQRAEAAKSPELADSSDFRYLFRLLGGGYPVVSRGL